MAQAAVVDVAEPLGDLVPVEQELEMRDPADQVVVADGDVVRAGRNVQRRAGGTSRGVGARHDGVGSRSCLPRCQAVDLGAVECHVLGFGAVRMMSDTAQFIGYARELVEVGGDCIAAENGIPRLIRLFEHDLLVALCIDMLTECAKQSDEGLSCLCAIVMSIVYVLDDCVP